MAEPTPTPRPPQTAVAPLNTIAVEDVGRGAARVDALLRQASGGLVTLDRIRVVGGSLPVVGNIMALVDVLGDVLTLMRTRSRNFLDWASLGINLIGVLPLPPAMAAARMSLRPTLVLVRQELRQAATATLGDGLIEVLVGHLNATIIGEIDDFVKKAETRLGALLRDAGEFGERMVLEIAGGMEKVALGQLDAAGNARAATTQARTAAKQVLNDPRAAIGNIFGAAWDAYKAAGKAVANTAVRLAMPDEIRQQVVASVGELRRMAPLLRTQMTRLADPQAAHSIGWLLVMLGQAVARWRARKGAGQSANIHPHARLPVGQAGTSHRAHQRERCEDRVPVRPGGAAVAGDRLRRQDRALRLRSGHGCAEPDCRCRGANGVGVRCVRAPDATPGELARRGRTRAAVPGGNLRLRRQRAPDPGRECRQPPAMVPRRGGQRGARAPALP
ncbi:hypothetical protein [Cupriavidus campinensis]